MIGSFAVTEVDWRGITPLLGTLISFGGLFTFLIVKTLTGHQQKMAELMGRAGNDSSLADEIKGLRYQVSMLQDRVNDMSIKLDGSANALPLAPAQPLAEGEQLRGSV